MRKTLISILLVLPFALFAQTKEFPIFKNTKTIGVNLSDSSEIKAVEYFFPEKIYNAFVDTINQLLTVQTRGVSDNGKWLKNNGQIIQYDLANQKVLWNKRINYQTSHLKQASNKLIFCTSNKNINLDLKTGKKVWKARNTLFFLDNTLDLGFGFNFGNGHLEGIDLTTGQALWRRPMSREYGWNGEFYSNDSTIIICASGLHSLNLRTGQGWDYNTITGKKDYKGTIAANAVGAALGILTGTFVVTTGHNLVRDIVSNTLEDSLYYYLASREHLAKIDKTKGSVKWFSAFEKGFSSKSTIFSDDSLIYMINHGYAFMGNRKLDIGQPFIAAFNKETGRKKYLTQLSFEDAQIMDFQVQGDSIYTVFKNKIAVYSKLSGDLIFEKEFPKEKFGELQYFIGAQTYKNYNEHNYIRFDEFYSTQLNVFASDNKIYTFDKELIDFATTDVEDIGIHLFDISEHSFISKNEETIITNNNGNGISKLDFGENFFHINNTLYGWKDKSFFVISVDELF